MVDENWDQYIKSVKKLKHKKLAKAIPTLSTKAIYYSKDVKEDFFNLNIPPFKPPLQQKRKQNDPVDAVIDLHGMTQEQAFLELNIFLKQAYINNKRHALVITGKGPLDNPGVIKLAVPRWFEHTELKKYINSYSTAKNCLGGAISVVLKRKR
jgi:hypothetical protein